MELKLPETKIVIGRPQDHRPRTFLYTVNDWMEKVNGKTFRGLDIGFNLPKIGGLYLSILQYQTEVTQ